MSRARRESGRVRSPGVIPLKDNLPTDRVPLITLGIILLNAIVYVLTIRHGSLFGGPGAGAVLRYGAIPRALTGAGSPPNALPPWETVLTSMFVHGSLLALIVNMLFLWIFGTTTEDAMGRIRFAVFYILGGVVALAVAVLVHPHAPTPVVGAGGAVSAVIGGYTLTFRDARVLSFSLIPLYVTVVEVPILVMVAVWFVLQAVFAATDVTTPLGAGGVIPYILPIAGFLFGMATMRVFATRVKPVPPRVPHPE